MKKTKRAPQPDVDGYQESGDVDVISLLNRIDFAPEDVVRASAENPSLFREAIKYRLETMKKKSAAKMRYEMVQAEEELELRRKFKAADEKITEGGIKSFLTVDRNVVAARVDADSTELIDEHAKLVVEAFRMRRDSLQIIGGLMRSDMSLQGEAGIEKLNDVRRKLKERFPGA